MAKRKQPKEPVKGFNVFQCQLCTDKPELSPAEFKTHLETVHQFDASMKYQKQMTCHMDATDWYQTDYDWSKDGELFAKQSIRLPRQGKGYWG